MTAASCSQRAPVRYCLQLPSTLSAVPVVVPPPLAGTGRDGWACFASTWQMLVRARPAAVLTSTSADRLTAWVRGPEDQSQAGDALLTGLAFASDAGEAEPVKHATDPDDPRRALTRDVRGFGSANQ